MKLHTAHAAALTLAAVVAASAATPSFAKAPHVYVTQSAAAAMAYDNGNIVDGHYAPGSTGYGRWAYNPEQPTDPDPRIGGALKLNTDR